jgi:hypothetical protein
MPPDAKILNKLAFIHEKFCSSTVIDDKFRGLCSGT